MRRLNPGISALVVGGLMGSGLLLGSAAGSWAADRARDPYASLDSLAQALTVIEARYVEEVEPDDLVRAAIRGMTTDLDPHTRYLTPEETRSLLQGTEGSYEGLGIETSLVAQGVRVERIFPGGPSERAGLLGGDVLLQADDTPLAGLSDAEVTALLHGPRGEPVDLLVERAGWDEPQVIEVVRDRIVTNPIQSADLDGIAYVRLIHFQRGAGEAVGEAIERLRSEGATRAVLLDLRDNPGGVLDEAVDVVDLFLDDGPIVSTRGRAEADIVHAATPGGLPADVPVAVLVNQGSASASEIVAGALQDTGRAALIGTRTYGKGSVQVLFETRDGGAIKLTTARYYTPSGEPVAAGKGRTPDLEIHLAGAPTAGEQLRTYVGTLPDDHVRAQLQELLSELELPKAVEPDIAWDLPPAERVVVDDQLAGALAYLRGL